MESGLSRFWTSKTSNTGACDRRALQTAMLQARLGLYTYFTLQKNTRLLIYKIK
jgi:hypothetical protein